MRKLLGLFFVLLIASPAAAAPSSIPTFKPIIATFDIYVGGIHLINADILFQEEGKKYRARLTGRAHGIWYKLMPWETNLTAQGTIKHDRFVPVEFLSHDRFDKKVKVTKLKFQRNGEVKAEFDPPNTDQNREQVTAAQRRGSLDPMTALLQMLAYLAVEKNCNITVPIFDGKRRFDITARDVGHEEIDEGDYGVFKGVARTCDARFTSISGEWKEQERDKFWKSSAGGNGRDPFHIWLGKVSPELPELPVRLDTGSIWGMIVMHLTTWRYAEPNELKG